MAENPLWLDAARGGVVPSVSVARTGPGSVTLYVVGDIDTLGVPVLRLGIAGVWTHDARRVIIDLTGATFIGVPGLRLLLEARRKAERRRERLVLRVSSGHMYRLLRLVGAGDITQRCDRPDRSAPGVGGPRPPATNQDFGPILRTLRWSATNPAEDVTDALRSVAETAATYLPGVEGAGLLVVAGADGLVSHAATDPVVKILDLVQQRSRRGPAWQSAWNGEDVLVDDLLADPRWPDVAAESAGLGVRSLLCLHLGADGDARGALTVYSSAPAAFGPAVNRLGHVFASIATTALVTSRAPRPPTSGDVPQASAERAWRRAPTAHPAHSLLVRTRSSRRRRGPESFDGLAETDES